MSSIYGRRQVPRIVSLKWRVALREHYARAAKVVHIAQSVKGAIAMHILVHVPSTAL